MSKRGRKRKRTEDKIKKKLNSAKKNRLKPKTRSRAKKYVTETEPKI